MLRARFVRFALDAALLFGAGAGQAQLLGLTHTGGDSQLAGIDTASAVPPIGRPELSTVRMLPTAAPRCSPSM